MALVDYGRHIPIYRERKIKNKEFVGVVEKNDDPKKLGRVRVRIEELHGTSKDIPDTDLPWVQLRAGFESGFFFYIPEEDDHVTVEFLDDNIYTGVYKARPMSTPGRVETFDTNYPKRYGWIDSTGNKIIIDKEEESASFTHSSLCQINIDKDGKVSIIAKDDMYVLAEKKLDLIAKKAATVVCEDTLTATVTKEATVTCEDKLTATVTKDIAITGKAKIDVTGDGDITVHGKAKVTLNSDGDFKLFGTGKIDIETNGEVTVKGTLIKLN